MPLSFNDAFMYENSDLSPGFEQEPIYQSDLRVWQFSDLGTGQYWYLEKLLQNIKLYFPNWPDGNEWVDEILLRISEEGYWFDFMWLKDILNTYKKIDQSILYTCIERTAKELCSDDFDRLRIIFYWNYDCFSFLGYYPGVKGTSILSKSLSLLTKPNPTDEHKTVLDWVNEDVIWIWKEINYHRWIYDEDSISVVSSLITGRVHLLIPISEEKIIPKNPEFLSDDNSDEIPF